MKGIRDLTGRVAIVTGASSGIGAGLARALAARGAKLALVARRADRLDSLAKEIEDRHGTALPLACDVEDRAAVEAAAARALEHFGRIDLLVNNAGYNNHALFKDHDVDDIARMMRVNYLGIVYWIKAVLPTMRARGEGWVINL